MSETAAEKPPSVTHETSPLLDPRDGFYEWEQLGSKVKQPYNFGLADDMLFAFAGLWERWRDPAGEFIETFTILTTSQTRWLPMCMTVCRRS